MTLGWKSKLACCRCSVLGPALVVMAAALSVEAQQQPAEWAHYGRDPGGTRFSPLQQIKRQNVQRLERAWTFNSGEAGERPSRGRTPALETTPLLVDGTLYLSTPMGRVIALDPLTGTERWRFDPRIDPNRGYGDFTNRGVATWLDRLRARLPAGAASI